MKNWREEIGRIGEKRREEKRRDREERGEDIGRRGEKTEEEGERGARRGSGERS